MKILFKSISNRLKTESGPREESEVAGFFVFSHLRIMGYFRLGRLVKD